MVVEVMGLFLNPSLISASFVNLIGDYGHLLWSGKNLFNPTAETAFGRISLLLLLRMFNFVR